MISKNSAAATVQILDNRSTPCAVGLIRAHRAMANLEAGAVLEIWSRDRFAPMEVPIWAEREGHVVRLQEKSGPKLRRYWRFQVVHR